MASVLLLSIHGVGLSLAHRLAQEGHITKVYFHEGEGVTQLKGVRNPSRVADPRKMLDQYDLVLCDQPGLGLICDELAQQKPVIGGGTFSDKLAGDASYLQRVLRAACQLELTPPQSEGLEHWVEGWFTPSGWASSFNLALKYTRLMPGDLGPQMQCMGSVVFTLGTCRLTDSLLQPFTELLSRLNYLGPFAVQFSINGSIQVHKLHAGFSFDSFQAMSELLPGTLFDFLYGTTASQTSCHLLTSTALAVRLLVKGSEAPELVQLDDGAKRHVWITDLEAKHSDHVCTVTARGLSVRECQRRAYRTIKNICTSPDVMYRNDIGYRAEECFASLKLDGWFDQAEEVEAPTELEEAQSA